MTAQGNTCRRWPGRFARGLAGALALLATGGCGGRSGVLPMGDAGGGDGGEPAAAACKGLAPLGAVALGTKGQEAFQPAVLFDGTQFAVSWLSTRAVDPLAGDLRFARVTPGGTTSSAAGVAVTPGHVGEGNWLVQGSGGYAALYPATRGKVTGLYLARFDAAGKLRSAPVFTCTKASGASLAPRPAGGQAVVFAGSGGGSSLQFTYLDETGQGQAVTLNKGNTYNAPWLGRRANGFVVGWKGVYPYLALLTPGGNQVGDLKVLSFEKIPVFPNFAAGRDGGYGMVYLAEHGTRVSARLMQLSAEGKQVGQVRELYRVDYFYKVSPALLWTGSQWVVVADEARADLKLTARLLDKDGAAVGATVVPPCMLTAGEPALAWGGDTLAVTYVGGLSGRQASKVCLARLRCQR